jgi:RNA polymerase nonessential primary-like sigma factor
MGRQKARADLQPQQREVIVLRFGLADGQAKTLAEVGRQLHLSRERVRQVENSALNRYGNTKEL